MTCKTQSSRFLILLIIAGSPTVTPQLPAPTALSDSSGCARHTCTWVPWLTPKTFHEGSLDYAVEIAGRSGDREDFVLRRSDKVLLRTPLEGLSASVSVVWSNDQRNFAVTWSDSGASGGFHVRAFHIEGDFVSELPACQKAWNAFKQRHWCAIRGDNIQAYAWLPDSRGLILLLSVYPTSDCGAEMGYTEAYVVEAATGDIQQHWGIKKLNAYMRLHPE